MKLTSWFKVLRLVCKLTSEVMRIETLLFSFGALPISAPVETSQMLNGLWLCDEVRS